MKGNDLNILLKDRYNTLGEIGKGAFGKVYKVLDTQTNSYLAVKRLNREEIERSDYLHKAYSKELLVMKEIESEYSVKLIEHFTSSNNYNIVMELCDGDLEQWNNSYKGYINENQLREILSGLNNVFLIMDQKNIVHRDLKLKNVLITLKKSKDDSEINFIPKLSDFGFSKIMDESDITRTKLGTPVTMAPEILSGKEYTKKCDIWSLGVMMFQLLFKTLPFRARNEMELNKLIFSGKGFKIPDGCKVSDTLHDLLKKMLTVDPNKRISWIDYLNHPFFKENSDPELDRFEKTYGFTRKLSEDNQGIYNITKAKNKLTGELVYIKEIERKLIDDNPESKKIFENEIQLMKDFSLNSKCLEYFIRIIDLFKTKKYYLIVTEYFEGQLLESYISKKKPMNDNMILEIIHQIIGGLELLNEKEIVLKSLTTKSYCFKYLKDQNNFQLKLFDFGLSKLFNDTNFEKSFSLDQPIGEKTNVLSFGLILYKICFGNSLFAFSSNQDTSEIIKQSK